VTNSKPAFGIFNTQNPSFSKALWFPDHIIKIIIITRTIRKKTVLSS